MNYVYLIDKDRCS